LPAEPLVTVVLPVRNGEATIAAAITSILNQTYERWELAIDDDGSTDRTAQIVNRFAARDTRLRPTYRRQILGLPVCLNQLVESARGTLVARMDADDVSYPQRLERTVRYLLAHDEVDLLGSSMVVFGADGHIVGKRAGPQTHDEICRWPARGFPLYHPAWVGRTRWFRRYPYRTGRAEDQDVLFRAYQQSVFANITEPLLGYQESRVKLRETLRSRLSYVTSTLPLGWPQNKRAVLGGMTWHVARAGVDTVCFASGLEDFLRRRRLQEASRRELAEWAEIWKAVNSGVAEAV